MNCMTRLLKLPALLFGISIAAAAMASEKAGTIKTERIEGTEWNVTVNNVVLIADGNGQYTLSDTARINKGLKELPHNPKITIDWTMPSSDGNIWLVAYEREPILNEKVKVTEASFIPSYGGDIQVVFKFADAKKWETVTQGNIGKRLAVFVNGQLMNAPKVNSEINSGNCSVLIPEDKIHEYLPNLDLEKLKQ